ncbi:MAG: chitobiase/beta-hexosaminidase C-terminal domain-containing protein [Bacteroides sp.]|nr:chitobiase/beta-hexosaminidase C-terminal domain-containing protein [Bacteroides sp.]
MKKPHLFLGLLLAGITTGFAQTESVVLTPHEVPFTPAFDIYGEPGTVCTLFAWGTYPAGYTGKLTFTIGESGHYRQNAIRNETYAGNRYSGFSFYRLDVPEGKITGLMNISNVKEDLSIHLTNLDSISIYGEPSMNSLSVSGCSRLRYIDLQCKHPHEVYGSTYRSLSSLHLNGCDSLQYLNCLHCTSLSYISGLSDCKALQYADFRYTSLDSLDLSDKKNLKKLFISTEDVKENNYRYHGLRKLNISGCSALDSLNVSSFYNVYHGFDQGNLTTLNISGCTNLKYLDCRHNPLEILDASGLENLQEIYIPNNHIYETYNRQYALKQLNVSGCTSLTSLDVNGNSNGQLSSLIVNGCTNLQTLRCRNNPLYHLDVSGCPNIEVLDCRNTSLVRLNASGLTKLTAQTLLLPLNNLSDLNISDCTGFDTINLSNFSPNGGLLQKLNVNGCTNLKYLSVGNNPLSELSIIGLPNLKTLDIHRDYNCPINDTMNRLEISNCDSLQSIDCRNTNLKLFSLKDCPYIQLIDCQENQLKNLNVTGCSSLTELDYRDNQLQDLNLNDCLELKKLYCQNNQIEILDIIESSTLAELDCSNNQLQSLNVNKCSSLQELYCLNNPLTTLDLSGLRYLEKLHIPHGDSSSLVNLNISDCSLLDTLDCHGGTLEILNVKGCTNLQFLNCKNSPLENLDVSGLGNLKTLYAQHESGSKAKKRLKNLNVSNCKNLQYLNCSHDSLSSIDLKSYDSLRTLICSFNKLTDLDLSGCKKLYHLDCSNNALISLNVSGCSGFGDRNDLAHNANDYTLAAVLVASQNALPLSKCYWIQNNMDYCLKFNTFYTNNQHIYITIPCGESLNFEGELSIGGCATEISGAEENIDYTINEGHLKFQHKGDYTLKFQNKKVEYLYRWFQNGLPHIAPDYVDVFYHIKVLERVSTPTFKPTKDTVLVGDKIRISCATDGAQIYYTLDGSEPSDSSLLYESPIVLTTSSTIKAIAIKKGFINSDVATAFYIVKEPDDDDPDVSNAAQNQLAAFQAYPNPCGETLYLKRGGDENAANIIGFRLLDLQGSERLRVRGDASQIDMSQLPAGVYVLEATDGNGTAFRHKIVKR